MAVKKSKQKEKKIKEKKFFAIDNYVPKKYQTLAIFGLLLIIFLAYFSPLFFGGKTFESGDIIAIKSFAPYIAEDGEGYSLWNPYIFCGVPAYSTLIDFPWFNFIPGAITIVRTIFSALFSVEYSQWTVYLILLAFNSFFLMKHLTKDPLISLFTAIAASFSTGIIFFIFIGHVTKLTSLSFFPLLLLFILKYKSEQKLLNFILLTITILFSLQGFHVQIIFYIFFAIGLYFIFTFIYDLKSKEDGIIKSNLKFVLTFIAASIIALLIQSANFTQIYEYSPYSTRGSESILDQQSEAKIQKSETDFYQYATNWSFSPGEIMTFIIPSYYGFGNSKYNGPLTNNTDLEVNTYFGQMPFVDVALYMGVIIFFLGLLSLYINRKNRFVQFLGILVLLSLLISFGRTFPIVYDLFFNYLPFFDKFRVPSMILVLVQISMPILAGLALYKIVTDKENLETNTVNVIKYSAYIFTGLFFIVELFNSAVADWFASRVNTFIAGVSQQGKAQQFKALTPYMTEMFVNDALIAFAITGATFWFLFLFIKSKLGKDALILVIILLAAFDLMRVSSRGANYREAQNLENLFVEPDYITMINNQKDTNPYRILNLKQDRSLGSFNQNSNFNAYFLKEDFYGYSAIKPRAYQDLMDVIGSPVNETLWRMLNVKYIVSDRPANMPGMSLVNSNQKTFLYENNNALPRAYFVDTVITEDNFAALNKIKANSIDPKVTAFIHEGELNVDKPDSTTYVGLSKYSNETIIYDVNASGNNYLFLGNTYLPTGWKAYIDDSRTEIYRTNHGFMGIVVPEGKHSVSFIYSPTSFHVSKYLSLILSSLLFIGLVFTVKKKYFNKNSIA